MIEIYPNIIFNTIKCPICQGNFEHQKIHWQGAHTCAYSFCLDCNGKFIIDLPINQATLLFRLLDVQTNIIYNEKSFKATPILWFDNKLRTILNPVDRFVEVLIEKRVYFKKIIILNTVDFIYGHSLLELFNIQHLNKKIKEDIGIVVIIQPMMKWLVPNEGIAEVWTVNLKFNEVNEYYPSISNQINQQLSRFDMCYLSNGYVLPTNNNIKVENFTKIKPYSFINKPEKTRITFIWREDPGRLWIRSIYLLKGMQKLGFNKILLPIHLLRIKIFFYLLHKKLNESTYQLTLAGLGNYGKFANYIEDKRVQGFSEKEERDTCQVYSESELVIGVHGSSMLLPSGHAGMTVSLMPSKRWGNFSEDILITSEDPRIASFQQRIIPLNLSLFETIDICYDMLKSRDYFVRKFKHNEDL